MNELPIARLEQWMRDYYFRVDHDLGSSGVQDYSLAELRQKLDIPVAALDRIVFHDSETLGGPGVRGAVADRFLGGDTERVMVTHGSSEANFLAMNALLRPGDQVITHAPCYPQLHILAEAIGCRVDAIPLRFEDDFRFDLDELAARRTPRTRMVIVNFPHNPTGTTLSADERKRLLEIVGESGAYLVWDAAFAEMTYDEPPLPDPLREYGRTLSFGTLSKSFGLPGLRVGWCMAAPDVLARLVRLRDYVTLHLSPLVELLAEHAIRSGDTLIGERRRQAAANRLRVSEWVAASDGRVEWVLPRGGVCGFVRFPGLDDVEGFCRRLAEEDRVLLVPGSCFGRSGHEHHARLGFGGSRADLDAGLARLSSRLFRESRPSASSDASQDDDRFVIRDLKGERTHADRNVE